MDYSSPVLIESGRPIPFPSSLVYLRACRPVTRTWNRSSSGFAIGVLERNTGEALMNLRRDSFAPVVGRYPLTRGTMGLDYSKGTNQFGDCRRAASRLPGNGSCKRPRDKLVPRFAKGVGKGRKGERGDRRNVTRKVFRETSGKSLVNLKVPPCLERVDNLLINLGIIKVPPVLSLFYGFNYILESPTLDTRLNSLKAALTYASRSLLFFFFLFSLFSFLSYTLFCLHRAYAVINLISRGARKRGRSLSRSVIFEREWLFRNWPSKFQLYTANRCYIEPANSERADAAAGSRSMRIPLVIRARCRKPVYNVVLFRGSPFKGILIVPREIGAAIGDPSRPLENPRVRDRVYGRGWLIERGRVEEREGKRERGREGTRVVVAHGKEMQSAM